MKPIEIHFQWIEGEQNVYFGNVNEGDVDGKPWMTYIVAKSNDPVESLHLKPPEADPNFIPRVYDDLYNELKFLVYSPFTDNGEGTWFISAFEQLLKKINDQKEHIDSLNANLNELKLDNEFLNSQLEHIKGYDTLFN